MLSVYQANTYYSKHFYNCEVTPRRTVGFYELEYYRCGTGFSCINDIRYPHTPGMMVFAKPGQTRFSLGSFECECIHFDCNEPLFLQFANSLPDVVTVEQPEILPLMQQASTQLQQSSAYSPLILYSLIMRILALTSQHMDNAPPIECSRDRYFSNITAAKEYMDNHFQEKITLKKLSQISYLSANFLRIKFQELIGISPHAYLEEIRMNHACRLLAESEISVTDISSACGYESPSYLDSVFRRKKRMSPRQYRAKHQQEL